MIMIGKGDNLGFAMVHYQLMVKNDNNGDLWLIMEITYDLIDYKCSGYTYNINQWL